MYNWKLSSSDSTIEHAEKKLADFKRPVELRFAQRHQIFFYRKTFPLDILKNVTVSIKYVRTYRCLIVTKLTSIPPGHIHNAELRPKNFCEIW